jgi:pyruvate kinase
MTEVRAAPRPATRSTRILATLGPASCSPSAIRSLLVAGADAFRINFSHGSLAEQRALIRAARVEARRLGREIALVADLQGPKLRVGIVRGDVITVPEGRTLELDRSSNPGSAQRLPISVPDLRSAARRGDPVLLGDGNVELRVERVSRRAITTRVVQGGAVHSHQGIYLPRARLRTSVLGPKDLGDLTVALREQVDFVAVSFVGSAHDIQVARRAISTRTEQPVGIIAKIERASALDSAEEILRESDAIMVARGDLGIEVPLERLAVEQKRLVALGQRAGRETIVATQMLLSMVSSPRPTRAEATDVANAILDGADAVMLSEESAIGQFPVQAVAWMDRIARATEGSIARERFRSPRDPSARPLTEEAVADAAVETAEAIRAGAIVVPTHSGRTARLVSRLRPTVPILALSRQATTRRRLALSWGVQTESAPGRLALDQLRRLAGRSARRVYSLPSQRPIVMTAGYPVEGRPTNLVLVTET